MNKKAKLAELEETYRKGKANHATLTENLLRMEGGIVLLRDIITEEEKASAANPQVPETPNV